MLKYLNSISKRLTEIKRGIENNSILWEHAPENPEFVESILAEIIEKDKEIEVLQQTLSRKFAEARHLSSEKKLLLTRIEKRAIGIHAENPEKLNEYGIKK